MKSFEPMSYPEVLDALLRIELKYLNKSKLAKTPQTRKFAESSLDLYKSILHYLDAKRNIQGSCRKEI
jgi:hypothetical protein